LSDVLDYVRAIVVSLLAWRILRAGRTAGAQGFDYGTGRLQTLGGVVGASLYVGLLLVLAVVSVQRCFHPVELDRTFTAAGALLQLVAFAVDGWLWLRIRRLARQEFSPVLEMQWQSARADALASLAVFASLGLTLTSVRTRSQVACCEQHSHRSETPTFMAGLSRKNPPSWGSALPA
jgi:divalent metal cation (Fe/Co/Zn/Cd) transporter